MQHQKILRGSYCTLSYRPDDIFLEGQSKITLGLSSELVRCFTAGQIRPSPTSFRVTLMLWF